MPLSSSEKARVLGQLSSGSVLATSLRPQTSSTERTQHETHVDHIVWGGVASSSGSNFSSNASSRGRDLTVDGVLRLEQSSSSEHTNSEYKSYAPESPPMRETEGGSSSSKFREDLDDCGDSSVGLFKNRDDARQALIRRGLDVETLGAQIPCDENGRPSSIGSIGHERHECQLPCPFIHASQGCSNGICCMMCHLPHLQGLAKRKVKDGKAKRDRYRRLKERLMSQIDGAPDSFKLDFNGLPDWLTRDDRLKEKLMHSLRIHQEESRQRRLIQL